METNNQTLPFQTSYFWVSVVPVLAIAGWCLFGGSVEDEAR